MISQTHNSSDHYAISSSLSGVDCAKNFVRRRLISGYNVALLFIAFSATVKAEFLSHERGEAMESHDIEDSKKVYEFQTQKTMNPWGIYHYNNTSDLYKIKENDELQAFVQVERKKTYVSDGINNEKCHFVNLYLLWFNKDNKSPVLEGKFLVKTLKKIKKKYYPSTDFYVIFPINPSPFMMDIPLFGHLYRLGLNKGQFYSEDSIKPVELVKIFEKLEDAMKTINDTPSPYADEFSIVGRYSRMNLKAFKEEEKFYTTGELLRKKLQEATKKRDTERHMEIDG